MDDINVLFDKYRGNGTVPEWADLPADVLSIARGCIAPKEMADRMPRMTVARIARAILEERAEHQKTLSRV